MVRERLAALLPAPAEETQSIFCPGDAVFPIAIDSNMSSADDVFMIVYNFKKKN
jgi:hypothetical protein